MYVISTNYLEHQGGTKFYETVLIREEGGPALLIKRWGSIALKNGGGQTKYERGSHAAVAHERARIINEKMGKGYARGPATGRMHQANDAEIDAPDLLGRAKSHYGSETTEYIAEYFGLRTDATAAVVEEAPAPQAPEPEVERGESWGSW